MLRDLFRSAGHHNLATLVTTLGTKVNDPIGASNDIQVVLDHQDRVALIHQALHHVHHVMDPLRNQSLQGVLEQGAYGSRL